MWISQENADRLENNTTDNDLGSVLQSGLSGGKIEWSRQILKVIKKNNRLSVDENNQNILVYQQEISIGVIDLLSALQVNKQFFSLVDTSSAAFSVGRHLR